MPSSVQVTPSGCVGGAGGEGEGGIRRAIRRLDPTVPQLRLICCPFERQPTIARKTPPCKHIFVKHPLQNLPLVFVSLFESILISHHKTLKLHLWNTTAYSCIIWAIKYGIIWARKNILRCHCCSSGALFTMPAISWEAHTYFEYFRNVLRIF